MAAAYRNSCSVWQKLYSITTFQTTCRNFSTSGCRMELRKMACVKVVDNSSLGRAAALEGKKVRIIHVYNKPEVGRIGDKVLVTIKGEKKRAFIVGCRQSQSLGIPRFDSNNVVLVDEAGNPLGTRIKVPIPSILRKKEGEFTKILSIATNFV